MIDAHIHLDQYDQTGIKEMINKWSENGIAGVVAVSTNLKSSYDILKLKQEYPNFIRAAIGHHPEEQPPNTRDLYELIDLVHQERKQLAGIGEIGLPTYKKEELYTKYSEEQFVDVLETFLRVAKKEKLPVSLHAVHEEAKKALISLKKLKVELAHFHWLKASASTVNEIVSSGYFVSVTPEVCYRERDQLLVKQIPLEQLLIETDGPWQHGGPFSERQTTPLLLKEITTCLANILHIRYNELLEIICHNTKQLW